MGADNKVIWSEGMFLRPQHFQQHDRYIERLVRSRVSGITPCSYGISELKINRELLIGGKFGVSACRGIQPDGPPVALLTDANHPVPLELGANVRNEMIYLTLPEQQPGAIEIAANGHDALAARFGASTHRAFDAVAGSETSADLEIGKLKLRYALGSSERAGYVSLGNARVLELRSDNAIILDESYIPPTLSCTIAPPLAGFITELQGLLHSRGEQLAGRATQAGAGAMEMSNWLLLQLVNRYEPLLLHYGSFAELHPVVLFGTLLEIAGEFATFMARNKRPIAFPEYRHDDLQQSFSPVMANLRQALSGSIDEMAIPIPLQDRPFGIKVGVPENKKLIAEAEFVLAVKADMQIELVRRNFPALTKIGPLEQIAKLVNGALPGIDIRPLPVAPRQIPFHVSTVYFELDRSSPLWADMRTSAGFAFHVGGDFPGLAMEFWAIRR